MSRKRIRKIRNWIELGMTRLALRLVRLGSLAAALRAADRLGWIVYRLLGIRKEVVRGNLRSAFPEKSAAERESIALKCYQNFARLMVEFLRLPIMSEQDIRDLCIFDTPDEIQKAVDEGRGAVVVAAHYGNWELMAPTAVLHGYRVHVLVKKQRNRKVGRLIDSMREAMGVKIIYLGAAVRGAFRALRNNEIIALLGDQRAGRRGIDVDFFGIPTSTHQGPAVFALRNRCPLLFGTAVRREDGRHRVSFRLVPSNDLDGATPENIRILTQRHAALLEEAVRNHPDHWFWMHKRWKKKKRPRQTE